MRPTQYSDLVEQVPSGMVDSDDITGDFGVELDETFYAAYVCAGIALRQSSAAMRG